MKRRLAPALRDVLFLVVAAFFFLGCIATSHRSAQTLRPGQFSVGGSYINAQNLEESDADAIHLVTVDGRIGVLRGLDFGLAHTWDVTSDNDGAYSTFWGDTKIQVTNRDNVVGSPALALGLMKGYVYHESADLHITTLPVMLSVPVTDRAAPFVSYRFELITDGFVPTDFENPRHSVILGSEFLLSDRESGGAIPKLGVSVGLLNSLAGGEGDNVLTLNAGISVDTP
jgi:hypothetical protein